MADILDTAQTDLNSATGSQGLTPAPVSPPPPDPSSTGPQGNTGSIQAPPHPPVTTPVPDVPAPAPLTGSPFMSSPPSDSLIIPPPDEEIIGATFSKSKQGPPPEPVTPPHGNKPKKQMKRSVLIAAVLFMLITLPIAVVGVKNTLTLFGFACDKSNGYCAKINANQEAKNANYNAQQAAAAATTAPTAATKATPTDGASVGNLGAQPAGTYVVYSGGSTATGYRYIQASGVVDAAIERAASNPSGADARLLATTYGLSTSDIQGAASHIAAGQTWVPAGVGCNGTTASQDKTSASYCGDWHWTTCQSHQGVDGVGCDVTTSSGGGGGGGGSTPTPTPSAQCTNLKVYKGTTVLDAAGLAALQPGDDVTIAVAGGNATKAHIRVNGGTFTETTAQNSAGEYTLDYTIPTGTTNFTVESEVYGADGQWH